jgi:hypothetical protein
MLPTFLGGGKRLFDGIDRSAVGLEIIEALCSPKVTHLRYAVKKKSRRCRGGQGTRLDAEAG